MQISWRQRYGSGPFCEDDLHVPWSRFGFAEQQKKACSGSAFRNQGEPWLPHKKIVLSRCFKINFHIEEKTKNHKNFTQMLKFIYIYHQFRSNVGKYTIHWASGIGKNPQFLFQNMFALSFGSWFFFTPPASHPVSFKGAKGDRRSMAKQRIF